MESNVYAKLRWSQQIVAALVLAFICWVAFHVYRSGCWNSFSTKLFASLCSTMLYALFAPSLLNSKRSKAVKIAGNIVLSIVLLCGLTMAILAGKDAQLLQQQHQSKLITDN